MEQLSFESFGVSVRVMAETAEILDRIRLRLPPGAVPSPNGTADESFGIRAEHDGSYRFERDGSPVTGGVDLDFALALMEGQLRIHVGRMAPGKIFVHAGVVSYQGDGIVIPGLSFSGKTTLVAALVRAGATYYSDEFAVIDESGLVHPFPKPLSVRDGAERQNDHPVEAFGGVAGEEPVRIRLVAFTEYRAGAAWQPEALTLGRGMLELLANTLAARERSDEAFRAFKRALEGATLLEGERGEAHEAVPSLLAALGGGQ